MNGVCERILVSMALEAEFAPWQRLRYIVGRWSSFTSVAFWEFFNEQSFSLANIPPEWTLEMARYLKSIDPYKHLVTTSFWNDAQRAVWESPDIDLTQLHLYPGDSAHDCSAIVAASADRRTGSLQPEHQPSRPSAVWRSSRRRAHVHTQPWMRAGCP